jgi:hypothetical protein
MAKMLLGLPSLDVLEVLEGDRELIVRVETTETVVWCGGVVCPHWNACW